MTVIWLLWLPVTLAAPKIFPLVDPGLFVISGVKTCGGGGGYCLLGLDCTLDEDFLPDNEAGQHCDGLKSAFTPSAHFVCCRATNKTAYKPPIVFPSVLTTANTEPMTARTTTLNILENEIDQVLQKVAQSVNAVNKSPVTEATLPLADETDQTSELRETEEADEVEEEGEEEEEEMVADSSIEELWQEMSAEDDDIEGINPGILEENKNTKESLIKPDNTSPSTMIVLYQTPKTEETSIENKSEENTISPGDILKGFVAEENKDDEDNENDNEEISQESPMIKDNQLKDNFSKPAAQADSEIHVDTSLSDSENLNLPQETKGNKHSVSVPKDETPQDSKKKTASSSILEEIPLNSENTSGNDKFVEKSQEVLVASEKVNTEDDLSLYTTSIPDILEEVINEAEPSNTDDDTQSNYSESTNVLQNEKTVNQENVISSINEVSDLAISVLYDDENQMETGTVLKENNSQLSNVLDVNDTNVLVQNATEPDENQLVTTTPMSPATQPSNNIQPTVMQGQPGNTEPCAKVIGEKCTQEVKFVINNQTLCFGSVYALDWVVTSASCALRIFRAGMLNVIIFPLTEMSKGHVKTIVVHESFAENSGASGQGMEANNIGLVQLHTPMVEWSPCVPCLPEAGTEFTGVNCSAVTPLPLAPSPPQLCAQPEDCKSARSESTANTCEGPSRKMADDLGFSYITLNCDILWEPRLYDPSSRGSGAPLYCGDGVLAGVETGAGLGLMVYTPLTPYLPWLLKNTRPGTPEQTFNVS